MNLTEMADYNIGQRKKWVQQAEEAKAFIAKLPVELQCLVGELDGNADCTYVLTLYGEGAYRMAKMAGVQGLKRGLLYGKPSDTEWAAYGKATIDGATVIVRIYSLEAPPNCVIEEYQESVTKYKVTCPQ